MARLPKPLPPSTLDILLALLDGPAHGFGIKKSIEQRTDGQVRMRAATLYEALHRLDRDALIEELDEPPENGETATSRWRFYRLTDTGAESLRRELARLESIVRHARGRGVAFDDGAVGAP